MIAVSRATATTTEKRAACRWPRRSSCGGTSSASRASAVSFAVIAASPIERMKAFAKEGGWRYLRALIVGGQRPQRRLRQRGLSLSPRGVRVLCIRSAGPPESFAGDLNDGFAKEREEMTAMIAKETLLKPAPRSPRSATSEC